MAEQLDDGEFWLPSQFLTDDDILSDFKSDGFGSGFGFASSSDLGSLSTETETSDDDDLLLSGLTRPVKLVSGSPQSTLYGWELTQQGSSHDSPTGPVELPKENRDDKVDENQSNNATLDLLNKAAGEVAKMKLRTERSTGTGFFDCSNSAKGLFCPPQPQPPMFTPPFYPHPQFRRFPLHMMWGPVQMPPPPPQRQIQSNKQTRNTTPTKTVSNNRLLGLPQSAWPPLPGQAQTQAQTQPQPSQTQVQPPKVQPMMGMYVGPQTVSVGTGVFLPRQVAVPTTEPKKKSETNVMKTKSKASQKRNNTRPATKSNEDEINHLPSEWVY